MLPARLSQHLSKLVVHNHVVKFRVLVWVCGRILAGHCIYGRLVVGSEIVGGEAAHDSDGCFVVAAGRVLMVLAIGCCVVVWRGLSCQVILCSALLRPIIKSVVVIGRIIECMFLDIGAVLGGAVLYGCKVDGCITKGRIPFCRILHGSILYDWVLTGEDAGGRFTGCTLDNTSLLGCELVGQAFFRQAFFSIAVVDGVLLVDTLLSCLLAN